MRAYPFPVPDRKLSHVPESIVWNRIARRYRTRFVNDPLRIYHTESDSITAAPAAAGGNAYSYALGNRIKLNEGIDYLRHAPAAFLRASANYVRFSLHVRRNRPPSWRPCTTSDRGCCVWPRSRSARASTPAT